MTCRQCQSLSRNQSTIISCRVELHAFVQDAPAGYMVHLDPDPGGVLKQYGIVTRRPGPFLRRMDNVGVLRQ